MPNFKKQKDKADRKSTLKDEDRVLEESVSQEEEEEKSPFSSVANVKCF